MNLFIIILFFVLYYFFSLGAQKLPSYLIPFNQPKLILMDFYISKEENCIYSRLSGDMMIMMICEKMIVLLSGYCM